MKKIFMFSIVLTALLLGSKVFAANIVSGQDIYINGAKTEISAINYNDNNYVKLRDIAKALNIEITYNAETNTVSINTDKPYLEEKPKSTHIDGNSYAREDFSQKANPDIFNEVYTRDAYNAIRQSIVDINEITQNTDENGYNSNYTYAHFVDEKATMNNSSETIEAMKSVTATMFGYYNFTFGYEPTIKNLHEYPSYRVCKVQIHKHFEPANKETYSFIAEISNLTDREKVKLIANYICGKVAYKNENVAGIIEVFTGTPPVNAICGTYADAFVYLCQRADIPCISVVDNIHAWNEVYVDGKWHTTDISYYDVARTDEYLFPNNYPRTDINKHKTNFAKELLVPGSTKSAELTSLGVAKS